MSTVFSSLVRPSRSRRPSAASQTAPASPPPIDRHGLDEPDLRDLNTSLQALTDIFPDVQPEVFREMLSTFSEESRLQVITETLLKHGNKYVRGRYRMPAEQEEQRETAQKYKYRKEDSPKDTRGVPLALEDKFRSRRYKEAAKEALYQEFKGLSHSTIKAVLAEYNWSYTHARPTLLGLSTRSWRSSITNFLMRRKAPNTNEHPLIIWTPADERLNRPSMPLLVKTKSDELNQELYNALIVPEHEKHRNEQLRQDFELAVKWNEEEAEREGEMYDCECCFIPNTLQQMSACDIDGHYICFQCIRFAINAALYDQGWARNINTDFCTLKCIAPQSGGAEECKGCIPLSFVKRALMEEQDGKDNFAKLNERFASDALTRSQLPLVQCPFCPYAELDDLALPSTSLFSNLRVKSRPIIIVSIASIPLLELLCFKVTQAVLIALLLFYAFIAITLRLPIVEPFHAALRRIHLKRRGLRFQCLSPKCRRTSCLSCSLPWHDPHTCFSSQLTSLRLTLERATTDAVKRTCPQCNLGFVKSEGCNKLVCLCGYSMCYVCRQGLAVEGYQHFCGHFRERPGQPCDECNKCDLYRVEDEDRVVKRAKDAAEAEWWAAQGESAKEGLQKEVGKDEGLVGKGVLGMKRGNWEAWIETVLESVLV
ncbi:hypothetical protein DDE82_008654 [Stemphylium lycopersici]|uniref:RING-type domain-containing protein n=1 Tax=Stemphylium lycopersici TaxID=183478 RepID=A0A364N8Q8_STELY|nr:hypothetical protein TW65_00411 [Stemphylium lycopersici]RAQ99042.1 hypothetical protein DDE82_008654 [Stemphylium lycopersici]RAR13718.1 hypothetical protein DDE83_002903 [Stemphylium lycopersici]